ncbi:hypothetical protein GOC74_17245 [Halomicrobium mukohataei]|uniref:Uncharacterized protein n=1 Tax=Halomicrobium mukohataei TaxID=57705 RepID=A0A847UKJ6_9EURY|nr:hypothetical protein [Halomicrobium mukohataei]NLV11668.1 hypothetical protein [Halomicrobium mukohataei]
MKLRNWIRDATGIGSNRHMLDPRKYPEKELRGDIHDVQFELKQKRAQLKQFNSKYQEIIEAGAEASSIEREPLKMKADNIERQYKFAAKKYQQLTKKLGLLYAIQGTRDLLLDAATDLTIDAVLEDTDAQAIQSAIRDKLRAKRFEDEQIDQILTELDFSAEMEASVGGSTALETDKHGERMKEISEASATLEFDLDEELDDEEESEPLSMPDGPLTK